MSTYIITLQSGTDQFCCIGRSPDPKIPLEMIIAKSFTRMQIPEALRGAVPSAAVLSMYAENGSGSLSVPIKSSFGAWDGSSDKDAMDALTLSSALETKSIEAVGNWTHWNVLGDATKGILEACASLRTSLTFVLDYGGTVVYRQEQSYIGSSLSSPNEYRIFGYPGDGLVTPHYTYLTVTVDDRVPAHSVVGGGALMF